MKRSRLHDPEQLALAHQFPVTNEIILKELDRNYRGLISTCIKVGFSREEAEDAVQDVLVWLFESKDCLYYSNNFSGLMFNHLRFQILKRIAERKRFHRSTEWLISEDAPVDQNLEQVDFIRALSKDVGPKVAYIWYYRNIKDYPYYKLANSFGCSEQKIRGMLELAKESSLLGGHTRHRSKYALIGSIYRKSKKTESNSSERRGRHIKIKQWTVGNPPQYQYEYDFERGFKTHTKCRKFIRRDGLLIPSY